MTPEKAASRLNRKTLQIGYLTEKKKPKMMSNIQTYVRTHIKETLIFNFCCETAAGLAQSVERLTAEREVAGSIPEAGPILRVFK